jgi:hypothetical protein
MPVVLEQRRRKRGGGFAPRLQVFQASFDVVASFLVGIDEVMDNVLLDLG